MLDIVCYSHPSHPGTQMVALVLTAITEDTRVPDAQDGPVSCKIKLLFLEAIWVLRRRINNLTPWPLKNAPR